MTLNLHMPEDTELKPRITVFGVGGAGGNAVNNMIDKNLAGAEFVVANTDSQALQQSQAGIRVQLGAGVTEGLGAGAKPHIGAAAAEESIEEIVDNLAGAHMCFITAGMGGGTGTGAAPIIARAARELGILTVGVVTKPFQFEGTRRMRQAEAGVEELQRVVDTLIIIPNQNLFRLANEKTTFTEAFSLADDVLYQGVKGVTDLMVRPGIINLDFADVRSVMDEMGKAMMGTGEASGEDRAIQAAEKAIANPLLDEISLKGARGVLINVTGGHDLTLFELDEAANRIRAEVDPDANIIVGSTMDENSDGMMRVSVVATGIDAAASQGSEPETARDTYAVGASVAAVEAASEPVAEQPMFAEPTAAELALEPSTFEPHSFEATEEVAEVTESVFDDTPEDSFFDAVRTPEPEMPAPEHEVNADRRPGEPTQEALARLQAAVSRQPDYTPPAAEAPVSEAPASADAGPERSSRFAINSLIHRMTGSREEQAQESRQEPTIQTPEASLEDLEDRDKVEIPAFLRRQAN